MLALFSVQSTAFANFPVVPITPNVNMPAVNMMAARTPVKKAAPKKVVGKVVPSKKAAPVKKAAPKPIKKAAPKKAPVKKVAPKRVAPKRAPIKKAPRKKKVNTGTFAYGLPGNFNPIGGGELNFDPYGFLEGKSALEVNRYREAELTHGRVGMLAAVGFIVQEKFHPLFSGVGGPAIDQIPQLPFAWYASLGLGITFCEFYRIQVAFRELPGSKKGFRPTESAIRDGYTPGQIGFDPLGFAPTDPVEFREFQTKELWHGRIGMIAAAIFLLQEGITGETWGTAYGIPDF